MNEHENEALYAAFQAFLSARPEPVLPDVTNAAVDGGRRIRRRRAALAATGALAVAAFLIAVAVNLSGLGVHRHPVPVLPADTARPTTKTPEAWQPAAERRGTSESPTNGLPHSETSEPR